MNVWSGNVEDANGLNQKLLTRLTSRNCIGPMSDAMSINQAKKRDELALCRVGSPSRNPMSDSSYNESMGSLARSQSNSLIGRKLG